MSEDPILNEIEQNKEEYIQLLRELIQAESYNPPGNEKNVALVIDKYLKDADIKSELYPFDNNRANLVATLNENFTGKTLFYNGHMDVVPPGSEEEWKDPPLSATIKEKKIFGRGAADMKGGLTAMVIALKILKKLNLKLSGNLILTAVADEETGGELGTGWVLKNKLFTKKCDFAVIGEPSGLNPFLKTIILGEKGRIEIKIVTNGISCHASAPSMGKNAIYMMSEIIQNLDKLDSEIPKIEPPMSSSELKEQMSVVFPSKDIFEKFLNEQPSLKNLIKPNATLVKSLTMIKGGIKPNVIPDKCEAVMDIRLLPGQKIEIVLNALRKLINSLGYQIKEEPFGKPEEIFVYLEVLMQSEASYWKDWRNSTVLTNFHDIVEKIYKRTPFYFFLPASADAAFYRNSNYCNSTILFGPGNAGTAHAINEFITIQDFINSIKVYSLFAYDFLK